MTDSAVKESNVHKDDHVDDEIAECLSLQEPRSFFLFAGAGSGKTRSLVNALGFIRDAHGTRLRLGGQKVGVITYTNAACDEITSRIDFDPLFHVSTIHSFAWSLIEGFTTDIREFLRGSLAEEIVVLEADEAKGRSGTKASDVRVAKIESKTRRLSSLDEIKKFTYNPNGDNKERSSLNHSEVISICAGLLSKPLMQRILVSQYPCLLIDESQDTNRHLIDALLQVQAAHRARFSLGLLGDTMQRIYADGKERIEEALPDDWARPEKVLNHRCPVRIVELINRIRLDVDGHVQEPRYDGVDGCVRLFVLPSESIADKAGVEEAVRCRMAQVSGDPEWGGRDNCKILTLEHHMAAKRMGFQHVFEPLYGFEDFRQGLLDGTLPALRFFTNDVLPVVTAQEAGDEFATAKIVRERSPLLSRSVLSTAAEPRQQLQLARDAVAGLMSLWSGGEPRLGAILENIAESGLFSLPDSLRPSVTLRVAVSEGSTSETDESNPLPADAAAISAFLEAPFSELLAFETYVSGAAPFDTHQGVKGLEFARVMVVMDDSEARGFMFNYEKLFGAKALSSADLKNVDEGRETTLDRTRRLLYVTCSRAEGSLALVAYSSDPQAVVAHVIDNGWFRPEEIIVEI
ncbi:MAG: AAA family ATPase [Actinomycetota bacterium]|nr:AAA family ATPase [Actinomycetota bacterium]